MTFFCVCVDAYIVVVALGNKNRKRSAACWMLYFLAEGAVVALVDVSMGMSWHQPCQGSGSGTTDWGNWVKGQGSSNCTLVHGLGALSKRTGMVCVVRTCTRFMGNKTSS